MTIVKGIFNNLPVLAEFAAMQYMLCSKNKAAFFLCGFVGNVDADTGLRAAQLINLFCSLRVAQKKRARAREKYTRYKIHNFSISKIT